MSGHAGPIQVNFGDTPIVFRISSGQEAALMNGRRACRTDLTASLGGNRASEGAVVIQRAAIVVASPSFVVVLADSFAFGAHIVEFSE
jgi:hypothetical protein